MTPSSAISFASAVVGALLLHSTLGTMFCWGNIAPYVVSYMSQSHNISYQDMSFCISSTTASTAICMMFSGQLQQRIGVKPAAFVGCCVLSLGIFLCSLTVSLGKQSFLVTYAVMFGLGQGLVFMPPIVCLMNWMPKQKGLATGIVGAGYGTGAFIFNMMQSSWINGHHHLKPTITGADGTYFDIQDPIVIRDVLNYVPSLFQVQALVFISVQILGLLMLLDPPPMVVTRDVEDAKDAAPRQEEYTCRQMIATSQFWCLVGTMLFNAQVVVFVATTEKTMGQLFVQKITDGDLTVIASVASLFSGCGRLGWGLFCDKTSFRTAMVSMCVFQAGLLGTLPYCTGEAMYLIWICLLFWNNGGSYSLFPTACSTYFGPRHFMANYGILFMGEAASELLASVGISIFLGKVSYSSLLRVLMFVQLASGGCAILMGPSEPMQLRAKDPELNVVELNTKVDGEKDVVDISNKDD